jgi:hypothetical protein
MAQPVWVLSVDLTTKTASFQTGMADAAKAARGSFTDIKAGADDMARATSGSMMESRHGVMLLGEEFGVHLPRALTSFIASIGPVGEAMAAAFPFLAIVVGATLLLEHLAKLKEKGEELTRSQEKFGTTVANVLGGLNDKLLEAGIKTDELNNDHLGALEKQLQLIDHASLKDLTSAFETLAKGADLTFAQLKTSWYQFGAGSTGAKHALEDFKASYEALLAKGAEGEGEAADLLAGTRKSAEHVLELQKQIGAALNQKGTEGDFGDLTKVQAAENELKKLGAGYTTKEIEAQQTLVEALRAQAQVQDKVNALKKAQSDNAVHTTDNKIAGDSDNAARQQAAVQRKADDEAEKLREEAYKTAVEGLQESERVKIAATKEGSAARLAAIDSAIKAEEARGLQETGFYKSLLTSRVDLVRQMTEEEDKIRAEAGKEAAEHEMRMGELIAAAQKQQGELTLSAMRDSAQKRVDTEIQFANAEYNAKRDAFTKEIAALDKDDKEYENKKKALQDKELELTKQHENQVAAIRIKAAEDANRRILASYAQFDDQIAKGLTEVITRQERMSKMVLQLADKMAAGLIENALKAIIADDMTKPHDAAAAARKAFLAGENAIPGPAGVVLGGVLAAGAFASVMAFEDGGIVPGVGRGDIVPAMLEPGEGVLSNKVMDQLKAVAAGNGSGGGESHYHYNPTIHIQALDKNGLDEVLTKHADTVKKHFISHARRLNQ